VNVVLEKKSTMLELVFKHEGTVNVPCDLTSEDFDLPIQGEMKLLVRFGDTITMIMRNCWFFHLENLNRHCSVHL
jgi:hypothetical protein